MTFRQSTLALGLLLTFTTAVSAQTVTDTAAKLAQALTHRRSEVRENAFSALLEKAQSGEDVSDAKAELLRFANLQHKERFGQQFQHYQAEALKVLVVIDDEIAGKVLDRTSKLVNAYIGLKSRDKSTAYEVRQILRRTFPVLIYLNNPEQVKRAADLAEQISPQLIKYDFEKLLPLIYRKYPTGRERIQVTERLLQQRFKDRDSWDNRVEMCVFAGLYTAKLDEETLDFLTALPSHNQRASYRANMLGLLSKRSEKAKQAAIQIMQDEFEGMSLRTDAASGLIAVHSPAEKLYWQADAVLELKSGYYYKELFDFAPKFSEKERRENHEKRDSNMQAKTTPVKPTVSRKPEQKVARKPAQRQPVSAQPRLTQEDSRDYLNFMLKFRQQVSSETVNGQRVVQIPRPVYKQVQEEQRNAQMSGRQALARMYAGMLKAWDGQVAAGRMKIVD